MKIVKHTIFLALFSWLVLSSRSISAQVQIITEPQAVLSAYAAREKTLLEKVFNYTQTGIQEGQVNSWNRNNERDLSFRIFWMSGLNGAHKCILTLIEGQKVQSNQFADALVLVRTIDIREFNQTAFRINLSQRPGNFQSFVGDERVRIVINDIMPGIEMERLRNAWGLAFQECPGRRSAF